MAGLARAGRWSPIREELGVEAFGVNAWTVREAGRRRGPRAQHEDQGVVR